MFYLVINIAEMTILEINKFKNSIVVIQHTKMFDAGIKNQNLVMEFDSTT